MCMFVVGAEVFWWLYGWAIKCGKSKGHLLNHMYTEVIGNIYENPELLK